MFELDYLGFKTMLQKLLLSAACSLLTLSAFAPTSAFAEDIKAYQVSTYDGATATVEITDNPISLIPRDGYEVDMYNNPNISETDFTLRLSSPTSVSGCTHMTKSELEEERINDKIKLKIKDSEIALDDDLRYATNDCDIKHNRSFFEVKLNRDKLIKNGVKKIALESKRYGEFTTSEIDVNEHRIELSVKSAHRHSLVTFWFFPKNAVILHTSHAKLGMDVKEQIREFGIERGLVPLDEEMQGFELPHTALNYVFFKDPKRVYVRHLNEVGENIDAGMITSSRTVYTASGPTDEPYKLNLMATLPGQPKTN